MSRSLTAQDRASLIRLASTLPAGSAERKAILAGLRGDSSGDAADVAYSAFDSWRRKNRSKLSELEKSNPTKGYTLSVRVYPTHFELDLRFMDWDRAKEQVVAYAWKSPKAYKASRLDLGPYSGFMYDTRVQNYTALEKAEKASRNEKLTENLVYAALDEILAVAEATPKLDA